MYHYENLSADSVLRAYVQTNLKDGCSLEQISGRLRRNEAIRRAHRDHGYSLSEIAHAVGLHYATISRIANPPDAV